MKINICISGLPFQPSGGVKVILDYANRLISSGYEVSLYFDCNKTFSNRIRVNLLRKFICIIFVYFSPRWFRLSKKIQKKCVFSFNDKNISDGDIVIATAAVTSKQVSELHDSKGNKFYFVQGYEDWSMSTEELHKTYKYDMKIIVIANWLKEIVEKYSRQDAFLVKNGIDNNIFYIDNPIELRNPLTLSMLYNDSEEKGAKYGLKAIITLKEMYPNLQATLFGVPSRPKNLPNWITYVQNAGSKQLREIYNNSSVFICSSIMEGFGLTGAESMNCGCAFVSTAYKGVFEYAVNERNALLSPIRDVNKLVENVSRVIENNDFRISLATQGSKDIQQLSIEKSFNKLEVILNNETS